jgi:hypothetical protein
LLYAPEGVREIEINVIARDTGGGEAVTKVVLRFDGVSEVRRN